jgi:hypothetical protein
MKVGRNSVINSNINNFCSPGRHTRAHITRINPDKNTFLNSNLLVSNILNHLSPDHPQPTETVSDAYVLIKRVRLTVRWRCGGTSNSRCVTRRRSTGCTTWPDAGRSGRWRKLIRMSAKC